MIDILDYNRSRYNFTLVAKNKSDARLLAESPSYQSFETLEVKFVFEETIRDKSININITNQSLITDLYNNPLEESDYSESLPTAIFYSEGLRKATAIISSATQGMQMSVVSAVPPVILAGGARLIFGLVDVSQFLYFLLFVNVQYPLNAEKFLEVFGAFNLDFMPNLMTLKIEGISLAKQLELEKLESPPKFYENDRDAMFLRSGFQTLSTFILFFTAYLGALALGKISQQLTFLKKISQRLRDYLEWGAFFRTFFTTYLDFGFSINLQFTNLSLDKKDVIASFSVALFSFLYFLGLPLFVYIILKKIKASSKKKQTQDRFGAIYLEYHSESNVSYYFTFVILIRKLVFSMALVFLYYYPYGLLSILITMSLINFCLLVKFRPYRVPFENVRNIISEILYVGVLITITLFVNETAFEESKRTTIGWTMIGLSMGILTVHMIGLLHMQFIGWKKGYLLVMRKLSSARNSKNSSKPFTDFDAKGKIFDAKKMMQMKPRFPASDFMKVELTKNSYENRTGTPPYPIYEPTSLNSSKSSFHSNRIGSPYRTEDFSGLPYPSASTTRVQNFFPIQNHQVEQPVGSFKGRFLMESEKKK